MSPVPDRVTWAVEQLAVAPNDEILEVGCGPGHAVALLCPQLVRGTITAFDRSALQVAKARERNRSWVVARRARIEQLTLAEAPAILGRSFTKVFAINVNAFWTDPVPSVASLQGLLRRGGRGYLIYEPPSAAALAELREDIPTLLEAQSLVVEKPRAAPSGRGQMFCIAFRPKR